MADLRLDNPLANSRYPWMKEIVTEVAIPFPASLADPLTVSLRGLAKAKTGTPLAWLDGETRRAAAMPDISNIALKNGGAVPGQLSET